MAILWDLAASYDVDFARLLALAGYGGPRRLRPPAPAHDRRAARADRLSPDDQAEALRFMAELEARREDG